MKYNFALLLANILFALNYSLFASVMERDLLSVSSIYMLQTLSLAVMAVVVCSIVHPSMARWSVSVRDALAISVMGVANSLGWSYALLEGMSLSSPMDAATIAAAGPSMTLIFAHFMGRRRLSGVRMVGLLFSLLGVAILVLSQHGHMSVVNISKGDLLLIVAMVVAAVNTLIVKPYLERYGISKVLLYYSLAAAVVSVPLFWRVPLYSADNLTATSLLEIVMMLIIGSAAALMLLFEGTEYLSPLHTSLYRYAQPLIAAVVVVARGQGVPTMANYIALAIIALGGMLVSQGVDEGA